MSSLRALATFPLLRSFVCFSLMLIVAVIFTDPAQAQEKKPDNFRRDMAAAKAERMAKIFKANTSQTANQADYDAIFYHIDIDIDAATEMVSGTVTMTAEVLSATLSEVDLNLLDNMTVSGVTENGAGSRPYTHTSDILNVTLSTTYTQGQSFTIVVTYSGTPDAGYGSFGFDSYAGDPMIWSLSEPFGARSWWPCKDIPADKADSVDIEVTVPDTLICASNGNLVSEVDHGSTKTYHWQERYPITTYLVSVAIHPYTTFSHWYHYGPTDSMEVQYYVYPDHYSLVQTNYAKVVPMIEVFADLFGEYPFINEKYGHAEFVWGGGMEHQTITSLGGYGEYLICHELAHMWWGDMITCDSFHHIWLNEGFAVYSEALWDEQAYGVAQYHTNIRNEKYLGGGTVYVEDPTDFSSIFYYGTTYQKAGWVLHMLRHVIGDATFFDLLKTYYADSRYQYGTITTDEFHQLCEDESGMDLDFFFHQWIHEEYYPIYQSTWTSSPSGPNYDISLDIDQLQTNYIFTMPIDIQVVFALGETTLVVWDSLASQHFDLTVLDEPVEVNLDPDQWILRTIEEPIVDPTFDRGILLVNGVSWSVYGTEITTAYEDSAFWGTHEISFWDYFAEPGGGYPSTLPAPLGHGDIPPDTLKQFSTVVWIGNNYQGDINMWNNAPILSYLKAGGNLVLATRYGQTFISDALRGYLGITWRESTSNTLGNCVSTYPGLRDMAFTAPQQYNCAVFDTALTSSESQLLFKDTVNFSTHRGLGVWANPAEGGTYRWTGGQFVFISGRPYRYNHGAMFDNMDYILSNMMGEPVDPTGPGLALPRPAFELRQNHPNPFNPVTTIRFSVPERCMVSLKVFDVSGQLVSTLISKEMKPDSYSVIWNGTNSGGQAVSSGVYFYRLVAGPNIATRKMVLIR